MSRPSHVAADTPAQRFLNDLPPWAQAGLVLAVVGLVSLLYPTGVRLDYVYEQGRRWRYDDLVAPFTFAVGKSDRDLQLARSASAAAADPYYLRETETGQQVREAVAAGLRTRERAVEPGDGFDDFVRRPRRYRDVVDAVLEASYRSGVVDAVGVESELPNGIVRVVDGAEVLPLAPEQLVTPREVVADVEKALQAAGLRDGAAVLPVVAGELAPNVHYDNSLTAAFASAAAQRLPTADAVVTKGQLIVARDALLTEATVRKLDSFRRAYEEQVVNDRRAVVVRFGYFLLSGLALGTLLLYIRVFHAGEFRQFNRLMFVLSLVLVVCFTVARIDAVDRVSVLVFPFAAVPIIVRSFYPSGVALFTHVVIVLMATFLTGLGYDFAFVQLVAGLVAVVSPVGLRDWSKIWRSLALIAGAYLVGFFGLEFVAEGRLDAVDVTALSWLTLGVFLTLLAYPLVPLLGRVFRFTSEVDLLDLADVSRPLLQRLATVAPGTMQHSLAVANLAETAAREIGADALLLRAAALYHDVGKTVHPEYFIENQTGDNPHRRFGPAASAAHVIAHVEHGLRLGREAGLPEALLDFVATHHGTTRAEYFYRAEVSDRDGGPVDEAAFRYPGPLPSTREHGVLMLADSVEAGSRSLAEPSPAELDALVEKIVGGKLRDGQLDACELTLAEVSTIRRVMREALRGTHHARVAYPEANSPPP